MAYLRSRWRRAKEERILNLSSTRQEAARKLQIDPDALAKMEREFHGTLVFPGDPEYDKDRQLSNPAFQGYPKVIAYCGTFGDVRLCLDLAHTCHLWVTSRAGGHSTAGYSINDGMVIDVSRINYVHVDASRRRMAVGAGTNFLTMNATLDSYKLHVPGGGCEDVCMAGYVQGGGYGFTSRQYGMNCDNVVSALLVLYDGRIVEASRVKNPDLYWAIRGGTGNNFGVLLEVTYKLHPLWQVWGFGLRWSLADAPAALLEMQKNYMRKGASAQLGYMAILAPQKGEHFLLMRGVFDGPPEKGKRELASLLRSKGADLEIDRTDSYRDMNHFLLDGPPPVFEVPDPWKEDKQAGFIARSLRLEDWKSVVDYYGTSPGPYNVAVIEPYGGAINAYPARSNAYIHRDVDMNFFVDVFWDSPCERQPQVNWLDGYMTLMNKYFNGHVYQNYPRQTLKDFRWMYWGQAFDDLLWIKRKYDPHNFFHYDQSISPYPRGARSSHHLPSRPRFTDRRIVYEPYSTSVLKGR